MLRALLPGIVQRYAIAGLALGFIVPLIGHGLELVTIGPAALALRFGEPFHVLAYLLPVAGLAVGSFFGLSSGRLQVRLSAGEVIEQELLHLSLHDRLTGLPNRMALEREIARMIAAGRHQPSRAAFLLLDLDKFKHVNDTLGHDAGDELLQLFAVRVSEVTEPQSRLFRLGGDEFAVTIANASGDAAIETICRAIETCAGQPFDLRAGRAVIGVSIGAAYLDPSDRAMPDVMKRADLALYAAKDAAGSTHVFYDAVLAEGMLQKMRTEQEIAAGLLRGEFFLEYQPVVSPWTRQISAFEALVRWRHPKHGIIGPEHFIGVAERSGHIVALGRFVLERAIADAGRWPDAIGIAVNVSPDEVRGRDFVDYVTSLLDENGVVPQRLTVELTESTLASDAASVGRALMALKAAGVKVAIDDFGAGLSSINHLRQFPIDQLKIDRSFTRELVEGGRGAELVEIILKLGNAFGIGTTVEGVESEDQLERVRMLGAAAVQGYLISRPLGFAAAQALALGDGAPDQALRYSA
jgi:diguanylate cyclase (GGDEF)-like protein